MTQGNLDFLAPLFEIGESLTDKGSERVGFGLGEIGASSSLAQDDVGMDGYNTSSIVMHAIGAALDHALTLQLLVTRARVVTNAAPWTLLRGVIEPSSVAVWILDDSNRKHRQERALRVWHHDLAERGKWEDDLGFVPQSPALNGRARAAQLITIANNLGLRPQALNTKFTYSDAVAYAAEAVSMPRGTGRARWRETSAFAHGRTWPLLRLSEPESAERIRGGYILTLTLSENDLKPAAEFATALLERALMDYAAAAGGE
ncbi:hypothetical protein [Nonomuraea sp. NPDC049129]|uniref:hypothetical protein n=1 Tax=Nonomuraea sp. NPDC049129 TaxID=3155272 RepID=UPI003402AA40